MKKDLFKAHYGALVNFHLYAYKRRELKRGQKEFVFSNEFVTICISRVELRAKFIVDIIEIRYKEVCFENSEITEKTKFLKDDISIYFVNEELQNVQISEITIPRCELHQRYSDHEYVGEIRNFILEKIGIVKPVWSFEG